MHIAFVIPGSIDRRSGGYRYDRRIRDALEKRGVTVDVYDVPVSGYHRRLRTGWSRSLLQELSRDRYDVIFQDALAHPNLVFLNPRITRRTSTPIVALVHLVRSRDPTVEDVLGLGRRYERRYLDGVDGYVFNSRASRRAIARITDPYPGIVAYPGRPSVDPQPMRTRGRSTGELRIAFVGHLRPIKGLDVLLGGLVDLTIPWFLTVVGSRSVNHAYVDRIDRVVDRYRIGDRIVFTGGLPREDVVAHLSDADILAVPSRYESFGMVYLEAMTLGVPPLASTAGGAGEVIDHDRTGFLVEPERPEAITCLLATLGDDERRLSRIGRAATDRVAVHPSWDDSAAAIHGFFDALTTAG